MPAKRRKPPTPRPGSVDHILAEVPRGRELCLLWARAKAITGDDTYRKFIDAYDGDPNRDREPLETYCKAASIDGPTLIAMFAEMSARYSTLHVEVIKHAHLPDVVRTSYEAAKDVANFDDRTAILKAEGVHHAPQGQQININQNNLTQQLGSHSSFTAELEALDEPRQLPAATTEFIDGELVDEREKEAIER